MDNPLEGAVKQTKAGQWTWSIHQGGVPMASGGGYLSEGEAIDDLHDVLRDYAEYEAAT
ncbi:MAG: hypothetical protein Q8N04_03100 [Nitrospira sp.]|nr:hypothetical protein [Nitrospira sp.]